MNLIRKSIILMCSVFLIFFIFSSSFAADVRVADILNRKAQFENERISITGAIYSFNDASAQTTQFYTIQDDWSDRLPVRTSTTQPDVGKRYTVTGVVTTDKYGVVFLSETSRQLIEQAAPVPKSEPVPVPVPEPEKNKWVMPLIIGAGAIFVVLVVVVIFMITRKPKGAQQSGVTQTLKLEPMDDSGKTIVMKRPPEGTMKLIPGKFIVLRGEDSRKEIRFQLPKEQISKEITFGRQAISEQNPYGHVQLKAPTVSKLQAKLIYANNGFTLVNYSTVNPTTVNGKTLAENESVPLSSGDTVAMGEVEFKYEA